ncbi:MAG: hypothetical protein ACXWLE_05180 [Rhizomicrobium sp.]
MGGRLRAAHDDPNGTQSWGFNGIGDLTVTVQVRRGNFLRNSIAAFNTRGLIKSQASNFAHDERRICPNAVKKVSLLSRAERIPASETLPEKANFKPIPIPGGFIRPDCAENPTTACKDIWHVDFDNDGVAERLLKVSGNSGAGRGCGLQFFVLLSSNNLIAKGDKEKLLLKLQQVNFADAYPASCTTALDWIKRSGRTVLEFHPYQSPVPDTPWSADTPSDTEELVHALSMARRKQSALLCSATFKITPQIVFDAAPQK